MLNFAFGFLEIYLEKIFSSSITRNSTQIIKTLKAPKFVGETIQWGSVLTFQKLSHVLCSLSVDHSGNVKGKWETDLGTIEPETWDILCSHPSGVLVPNSAWEKRVIILHSMMSYRYKDIL